MCRIYLFCYGGQTSSRPVLHGGYDNCACVFAEALLASHLQRNYNMVDLNANGSLRMLSSHRLDTKCLLRGEDHPFASDGRTALGTEDQCVGEVAMPLNTSWLGTCSVFRQLEDTVCEICSYAATKMPLHSLPLPRPLPTSFLQATALYCVRGRCSAALRPLRAAWPACTLTALASSL